MSVMRSPHPGRDSTPPRQNREGASTFLRILTSTYHCTNGCGLRLKSCQTCNRHGIHGIH
eukprot:8796227-Lingulodinium_polyedra.AAC.1